jgi:hypothetical protein
MKVKQIRENQTPSHLPERVAEPLPPPKPKKKYIKRKNRIEQDQIQPQPKPIEKENHEHVVAAVAALPVVKEEVIEPAASEAILDARSARKFRAQIKAGDHFLIHSHSLSH